MNKKITAVLSALLLCSLTAFSAAETDKETTKKTVSKTVSDDKKAGELQTKERSEHSEKWEEILIEYEKLVDELEQVVNKIPDDPSALVDIDVLTEKAGRIDDKMRALGKETMSVEQSKKYVTLEFRVLKNFKTLEKNMEKLKKLYGY